MIVQVAIIVFALSLFYSFISALERVVRSMRTSRGLNSGGTLVDNLLADARRNPVRLKIDYALGLVSGVLGTALADFYFGPP